MMFHGRKKPYTVIGISRIPCVRCGDKSRYQWNACSNANNWVAICAKCDLELNKLVLKFFRFANHKRLMADYRERVNADNQIH